MAVAEEFVSALAAVDIASCSVGAIEVAFGLVTDDEVFSMARMGDVYWRAGSGDVTSVSVNYRWDMYHSSPVATIAELREKAVFELSVSWSRGRALIEAALTARFGAPRPIEQYRVYGERWLVSATPNEGDTCQTKRFDKLPDWALPSIDTAARDRFLVAFFEEVARAASIAPIKEALARMPKGLGIEADLAWEQKVSLTLSPAVPAVDLARVLGWPNAIGESVDVHQASWVVKMVVGKDAHGFITEPPTYGRYEVRASLSARASGGKLEGHGARARAHLAPLDTVHDLSLSD